MLLIAHRCGPDLYPEQTIASARHALQQGADIVEMDVQFTSDNVPVICHDPNTKRIFGIDNTVPNMTLAEFLTLRHVGEKSYSSHSLDDVLSTGIAPILLHCKLVGEQLAEIVSHITTFGYEDKIILGVLEPNDITIIHSANPRIRTLAFMPDPEEIDAFIQVGVDIIRLWETWMTQERVDYIHSKNKEIWVMAGLPTPTSVGHTTEESLLSFVDMGVDGVLIDNVLWAIQTLAKRS